LPLWLLYTLVSALFLGLYEVAKKTSVRNNPVAPVLYLNALFCASIASPFIIVSHFVPWYLRGTSVFVSEIGWEQHLSIFLKSLIVGCSWTFAYFAVKHLPVSVAGPIRATSPVWTVGMALILYAERPHLWGWIGMVTILGAFYLLSRTGNEEGIHFLSNRWVGFMVIATLLASCSALYDKYLLQIQKLSAATVQAWFSMYLLVVLLPLLCHWWLVERREKPFVWKWSILGIATALLLADFAYFSAIAAPEAMISIVSTLRRNSVIVSFLIGVTYLKERFTFQKLFCVLLMVLGSFLLSYGSG
jgi:bacterial/archaeal transporter family protein